MELRPGSLAHIEDQGEIAERTTPSWWAYAREFPDWYVWRGVSGLYYARIPGISPQRVLRAPTADLLRDELVCCGAARRRVALPPYVKSIGSTVRQLLLLRCHHCANHETSP
jgi:hypothetical protein